MNILLGHDTNNMAPIQSLAIRISSKFWINFRFSSFCIIMNIKLSFIFQYQTFYVVTNI